MADFNVPVTFTSITSGGTTLPLTSEPTDISSLPFAPWTVTGTAVPDSGGTLTSVSYSVNNGPATDCTPSSGTTFTIVLQVSDMPCNGSYLLAVYAYATNGGDIGTGFETKTLRQTGIISPPPPLPAPPGQIPPPPPPSGPPFPVI